MKCQYCGGTLDLEDRFCKHCGQVNTVASEHVQEMEKYQQEFEQTRRYVHEQTAGYNRLVIRVVTIAVLWITSIILLLVAVNANSVHYNRKSRQANARYKEYSKEMDRLLEEEDYLTFKAFVEEKQIRSYEEPYGAKYSLIIRLVTNYGNMYANLYDYLFPEPYMDPYKQIHWLNENYQYFQNICSEEPSSYEDVSQRDFALEERLKQSLNNNIKYLLMTYGGFTEEEAESMKTLSDAKRAVLLEEKLESRLAKEDTDDEE